MFGKKSKPFEAQADYRAAADNYHGEWLSNEITGTEPTMQDEIQTALPRRWEVEES